MAITREWQSGFDTGEVDAEITGVNNGCVRDAVHRSGQYGISVGRGVAQYFTILVSETRQKRGGMGVYWEAGIGTIDGQVFIIRDSGDNSLIELKVDVASEELEVLVDGVQKDITTSSIMNGVFGTWQYFTFDVKIDNAAGWITIYLDGNEILTFAGDTGNVDVENILFGTLLDTGAGGQNTIYDDCYIEDTVGEIVSNPPVISLEWIEPNGNGNYAQWVGSDGNQVDNYLLVDEQPPNTADYVEVSSVDQLDSYAMTNYVLGAGEAFVAVIPIVYAQRYGASEELAVGLRYSGTDVIGSDTDPGAGAWAMVWDRQTTKPGGGAWDQAAIDDVEAVIKSRGVF